MSDNNSGFSLVVNSGGSITLTIPDGTLLNVEGQGIVHVNAKNVYVWGDTKIIVRGDGPVETPDKSLPVSMCITDEG